jgi:hypothetical protein
MPIALVRPRIAAFSLGFLLMTGIVCLALSSCRSLVGGKVVYDRDGIRIGLQEDPSITRSTPPATNAHPASFSPEEVAVLLGAVRVSGWSGTLVGYFETPRTIPLFEESELRMIAAPIAEVFQLAGPSERVFFTLPNPKSAYGDATAGFLFVRHTFVHVVVTDHKAFARADTGGGDEKDPRDMKGMKLWVTAPYQAADVPSAQEPDWAPFETVHLSLDKKAVLAGGRNGPGGVQSRTIEAASGQSPSAERPQAPGPVSRQSEQTVNAEQDFRLQIRELTQSNLDLRERLAEQTQQLKDLKDELMRLRRELDRAKPKSPAPKKPIP